MADGPENRLLPHASELLPSWANEGNESFSERMMFILQRFMDAFLFNVVHKRSVAKHLRYLGVRIGSNCSFNNRVNEFGSEPWLIEIGDNVTIAGGVVFLTHDGSSRLFRNHIIDMNRFGNKFGTIIIHNNSFIGENAIILPEVVIGPNSIVGAGSVVTKTVPPNSVVVGNPAKVLYTLDEYEKHYKETMLPLQSRDKSALRKELTYLLWGQER